MANRPKIFHLIFRALFPGSTPGRVAVIAFGAFVTVLLVWTTPMSPAALGRADAALGLGDPRQAAERYDAVAAFNLMPSIREEALYRASMVYAVDLRDPVEARKRLERLLRKSPEGERLAEVYDTIGHLAIEVERRPDAAARAFLGAYEAAPRHPRGAERLTAAARARGEAGDTEGAADLWDLAQKRFPELRTQALLAHGELRLSVGDAEGALPLYILATESAQEAGQKAVARLGAAACMERLGNLEGAISELDASDLPSEVRITRTGRLRARLRAGER